MKIRAKTVRRLLVVAVVLVVGMAAVVGVRTYKASQRRAKLAADRDAGIAAFQSGDHPKALDLLKNYIRKDTNDFDALFAYASARAKVEMPNDRHLPEAIQSFELLRSLRPDEPGVQRALLELYTHAGYGTEALTLSDLVLATRPAEIEALRAKSISLFRAGRFDQALAASLKLNDAAPLDLAAHTQTYWLLLKTRAAPQQVVERYRGLLEKHPDDPRFEMLLAIATGDAGDRDGALTLLRSAARRTPPDAAFVAQLARTFDQQRLFDESRDLLERAAGGSADPAILRVLVQRLWQNGQYEAVLARLDAIDHNSPAANDGQLLAFRALSLLSLQRDEDAKAAVAALKSRAANDNSAASWASALEARQQSTTLSPTILISRYQNALSRGGGDNGIVRYWLAEAHQQLGESDAAIRQWQTAAELMPSWSAPHVQMARLLLSRNRPAEAVDAAAAAVRCSPEGVAPMTTLALSRYALLQQTGGSATDFSKLTQLVAEIQRLMPGEPETLSLHALLLSRAGQTDAAAQAIRAAIPSADKNWDADILANLLAVSRENKLGLEPELLEATREAARRSPRMALRHALDAAQNGRLAEGKSALETASTAASTQSDALAWQIALAQFREAVGDSSAAATWVALGDAHPTEFAVQSLILRSAASARKDRAFYARSIDRMKQITGDDGSMWRLARARFLLSRDESGALPPQRDSADAVALLSDLVRAAPDVPEYRVLLARAMQNLGNDNEAAKQLEAAAEIDPRSVGVQLELARLLIELGNLPEARKHLQRASESSLIEPAQRVPLAAMLSDVGLVERAATTLEASASESRGLAGDTLLARLYRRTDRDDAAAAIYERILAAHSADADSLAEAADFLASRGDVPAARARAIARIETFPPAKLTEARKRWLLARFEEKHGSASQAVLHLTIAADAAPTDTSIWRDMAMMHARLDQFESALATIEKGVTTAAEKGASAEAVEALKALRPQIEAMRKLAANPDDLSPLIDALSADPSRAGEADALRALQQATSTNKPTTTHLTQLRAAAERFNRFLPLQAALAAAYLQADQRADASVVAYKLLDGSSIEADDTDAVRIAANVFAACENWPAMLAAANRWKKAVDALPGNAEAKAQAAQADLSIATALQKLGRFGEALQVVAPYLQDSVAAPRENAAILTLAGEAMIASGAAPKASELIAPLLKSSPEARQIWFGLIGSSLSDGPTALEWANRVRPFVDVESKEPLAFARACVAAGVALAAPALLDLATTTLTPLVADETTADADAMFLAAAARLHKDEFADAERLYRAVLRRQSDHAAALNDLAWTLLSSNKNLAEARDFAKAAVAAGPNVATHHETLARIQAALGDFESSLAGFEAALRIEPSNIEAMIGKAFALKQSGDMRAAKQLVAQVEPLLRTNARLSRPAEAQLKDLRAEFSRGDQ